MKICILGVDFNRNGADLPRQILSAGLVVVPSGPGLACDLPRSAAYRRAMAVADWVIPDSGLMVLVWNVLNLFQPARRLERYSGLRLLREVLPLPKLRMPGMTFWVMPSAPEQDRNLIWLREEGFCHLSADDCYLAPVYQCAADGSIQDSVLLARLEARRPKIIFLNVGGGVQELLGCFLREHLTYRPTIICTGAAIAFLSGGQVAIPPWADRLYLGWLLRTLADPAKFGRRYWNSVGLVKLIARFRHRSPVMSSTVAPPPPSPRALA